MNHGCIIGIMISKTLVAAKPTSSANKTKRPATKRTNRTHTGARERSQNLDKPTTANQEKELSLEKSSQSKSPTTENATSSSLSSSEQRPAPTKSKRRLPTSTVDVGESIDDAKPTFVTKVSTTHSNNQVVGQSGSRREEENKMIVDVGSGIVKQNRQAKKTNRRQVPVAVSHERFHYLAEATTATNNKQQHSHRISQPDQDVVESVTTEHQLPPKSKRSLANISCSTDVAEQVLSSLSVNQTEQPPSATKIICDTGQVKALPLKQEVMKDTGSKITVHSPVGGSGKQQVVHNLPPSLSDLAEPTQTELSLPVGLTLPLHFRRLLELFRICDTVVSMLHNRSELCTFNKVKPAVQEILKKDFEESHIAQFQSVYPSAYRLRYEKQIDKYTRRFTGSYVLVLEPNLRTDGTSKGHESPSKGHFIFAGTRLIQRRNRFHRLLLDKVFAAHRLFLTIKLGLTSSDLPEDASLRRWHPSFPLERALDKINPTPLPIKPSDEVTKLMTAKDAVKAFQTRALFRDAEACRRASSADPMGRVTGAIPSPSKAHLLSPLRSSLVTSSSNQLPPNSPGPPTPSRQLFATKSESALSVGGNNSLRGISEALLSKVRAKEKERRELTQLTRPDIPERVKAIYGRLPSMITQIWTILRATNGLPTAVSVVAKKLSDSHASGLSPMLVGEHLDTLAELMPCWVEKLPWSTPHIKLKDVDRPVKDVLSALQTKLNQILSPLPLC